MPPEEEVKTEEKPAHDEHLSKTVAERNAAKAKARELETQLADLRSKLDGFEQEKTDRENELSRKAGEFSKIEEQYKSKLATKDKELAEAKSLIETRQRLDREGALVEAVASKSGIVERAVVRGVLRLAADSGFDAAPAELTDDTVAEAIKVLRRDAPSLFATKSTPAPNAGTNTTNTAGVPADIAADPRKLAAYEAGRAMSPNVRRFQKE